MSGETAEEKRRRQASMMSDLSKIGTAMRSATEDTDRTSAAIKNHFQEIARLSGVIRDLAKQTHMLALNATLEAARAGEPGRGFTVVAQEVKNLAGRASKTAAEIDSRIEEAIRAAEANTHAVETLRVLIDDSIGKMVELNQRI